MKGFFAQSSVLSQAPVSMLPKCGACGLYKGCQSPKMRPSGRGKLGILIVGEAPGRTEDETGKQFIGKAGERLEKELKRLDIDMREDCWLTNSLICRPPNNHIANPVMVDYCRPNLTRTIEELKPHTIVLLGGTAVKSLIGGIWKESPGAVSRWVGWNIPCQHPNVWICPTYHPSYLERENNPILDLYFAQHLEAAFKHRDTPWERVPDWEKEIEVILDTREAARVLREFEQEGGLHSVDYEGTTLKPEYEGAETLCCSVCHHGKRTIAYPWHGEAIDATRDLLWSDRCSFIASNLKHEDRHTRFMFGRPVRHWAWDTMLASHTIDNRSDINGLKFQAFVHLGMPAYDDAIHKFLRALKGKKTNLAKSEIDIRQLLRYCGVDSLLEFKLAVEQWNILKIRPEILHATR